MGIFGIVAIAVILFVLSVARRAAINHNDILREIMEDQNEGRMAKAIIDIMQDQQNEPERPSGSDDDQDNP